MAHDDPPALAPELSALALRAAYYLGSRMHPAPSCEQLLQRNTVDVLRAYVRAEEELDRVRREIPVPAGAAIPG